MLKLKLKVLKIATIVIFLLTFFSFLISQILDQNWSFVCKTTNLILPAKYSRTDVKHNTEVEFTGQIFIKSTDVEYFIKSNKLEKLNDVKNDLNFYRNSYIARQISDGPSDHFYCKIIKDLKSGILWELVLNYSNGVVQYQLLVEDFNGDKP